METNTRGQRMHALAIAFTALFILAGCAASAPPAAWKMATPAPRTAAPTVAADAIAQQAWIARPAFVRTSAQTEEAYAFALAHPEVLQWIPCYCGCAAMGHRSNLDCFIVPGDGRVISFEEHASYCGICVKEALLAKQLLGDGKSLREIRNAVDAQFGGHGVPGTDTQMPSA